MRVGSLCSGYGGLEMGLALAGVDVDLVWYAETADDPAAVMSAHHPHVPNLGDLTSITAPPQVDVVTAGFPCQPVSQAGLRQGIHDERWLIDDVVRVFRASGATWLLLENVRGILSANGGAAFAHVVEALAREGLSAEWTVVRAADVGACHQRARWFCVATHPDRWGLYGFPQPDGTPTARLDREQRRHDPDRRDMDRDRASGDRPAQRPAPDPDSVTTRRHPRTDAGPQSQHARRAPNDHHRPADAPPNPPIDWGPYADAVHRHATILGRPAPQPLNGRALNARFVEWMMMLPEGHVTDHLANRRSLKVLGNGVVPLQAAAAIVELAEAIS